ASWATKLSSSGCCTTQESTASCSWAGTTQPSPASSLKAASRSPRFKGRSRHSLPLDGGSGGMLATAARLLLRDPRGQLGVDDRLEGLEGHGADQLPAVDEEGRRAVGAHRVAGDHVALDRRLRAARFHRRLPLRHVQPDLARYLLVVGWRELVLLLEEPVVHRPELVVPLLVGGHRGLRRRHGV